MKKLLFLIPVAIVAAGILVIALHKSNTESGIPKAVLKKTVFTVFSTDPADNDWQLDKKAVVFDEKQGVLRLHFSSADNRIVMNEQATPDPFNDIPNYYSILLNKLHAYKEVQTNIGSVALTHPEELKGAQSAVINVKGTLIFAQPDKEMSENQWQNFFNNLIIVK